MAKKPPKKSKAAKDKLAKLEAAKLPVHTGKKAQGKPGKHFMRRTSYPC